MRKRANGAAPHGFLVAVAGAEGHKNRRVKTLFTWVFDTEAMISCLCEKVARSIAGSASCPRTSIAKITTSPLATPRGAKHAYNTRETIFFLKQEFKISKSRAYFLSACDF